MDWMDEEDQPIWVVYRLKSSRSFALQTTTKEVFESMTRFFFEKVEVIAEDVTYETANKMIGLTKG
jgi:hypothetical protein